MKLYLKQIIENSLEKAITYQEYRILVKELLEQGKSTGVNLSEDLVHYSLLNHKRMKRLDKTTKLSEETLTKIKEIKTPQTWLVLTEGWCGDAAQNLPIINKVAQENININLKIVLRDQHLELMDNFLTNGSKSIPKMIILNTDKSVKNTWGPRPSIATKMVQDYKKTNGVLDTAFKKDLQVWYNKDKGNNLQKDIIALLE